MPEGVSGHIEVEVTSKDIGGVTGGPEEAVGKPSAGKKQTEFFSNSLSLFKRFLPFLGIGGGIFALVKSSKAMGTVLESLLSIVGAVVDVILMPLMPIFAKILEAVAPLIPRLMGLADAIITPFVNIIIPLMEDTIEWLKSNLGGTGEFIEGTKANTELLSAGIETLLGREPNISESRLKEIFSSLGLKTEVIPGTGEFAGSNVTRIVPTQQDWASGIQDWFKNYNELLDNIGSGIRDSLPDWFSNLLLGTQQPVNNTLGIGANQGIVSAIESLTNTGRTTYINNEFNVGLNNSVSIDEFMSEVETRITKTLNDILRQ